MKNASYCRAAVLALGLAGLVSNAAAQSTGGSASASLSDFTYQLFDLDLTDGITPSLSFVETVYSFSLIENPYANPNVVDERHDVGATSAATAYASASTLTSATTHAASASATELVAGYYLNATARNSSVLEFTLSPSTGVRFSILAKAESDSGAFGSAQARTNLSGQMSYGELGTSYRFTSFHDTMEARDQSMQGSLYGYLESDQAVRNGLVAFATDANASAIPAVPEPQTYLMMLAGVAILTGARTLRKR